MLAGENMMKAAGKGTVTMQTPDCDITLVNVLYVPGLQCNFISVSKAVEFGQKVVFSEDCVEMRDKHGNMTLRANKVRDLFLLKPNTAKLFFARKSQHEAMQWHYRYGHLNFGSMRDLVSKDLIRGMQLAIPSNMQCTTCIRSKCTQKPFGTSESRSADILQIIHTDLCGPMNKHSIGGAKYMLTFIDDHSRYAFVYFLKSKDETFCKFREFLTMVERQTGKAVKILRSDNGTEYVNHTFENFLKEKGIMRQLTVPYTPQQNGVAERFNRTLIEMSRTMLIGANLSEYLWAEAINAAVYLRNRAPSRAIDGVTPFELFMGKKPYVGHLKTFGSIAIALDKRQHSKFQQRGRDFIMVGYSDCSKAYRLFDKNTKQLIVSRDVYFVEPEIQHAGETEFTAEILAQPACVDHIEETIKEDESTSPIPKLEQCKPQHSEGDYADSPQRGPGRPRIVRTGGPGRPRKIFNVLGLIHAGSVSVPVTVEEALTGANANEWRQAMHAEYDALLKNNTWELAELPKYQKAVSSKWVFSLKRTEKGEIERFKARLVAKGCSQKFGVNYNETFSPVVRYETIRMIFAVAAEFELHLHQMDVSTAYLNSVLEDEVFMIQPKYFVDEKFPNHVLKLKKALYGLKQSGRQWNQKLNRLLQGIGFQSCTSEPCVYIKHSEKDFNIIAVYVDDLLLASSCLTELKDIKLAIGEQVDVVDKGPVIFFISLEVHRVGDIGKISISQKSQIRNLLKDNNMETCKPIFTPLDPKHQITCGNEKCQRVDKTEYQSLIGSLLYIAINTRPDILHSVCKLSQRNTDPHSEHLAAAKRILRYLSSTIDKQLTYQKTGKPLKCYTDADWGGDESDRKSFTGYAFIFGGAIFSYESKKQPTVALSSTEAEYMALTSASKEAQFLIKLISELRVFKVEAITINVDNISAMNLAKNPVYHQRSKHIDIKYHYIRDVLREGFIKLEYCSSSENAADIFTKNLPKPTMEKLTKMIGLI